MPTCTCPYNSKRSRSKTRKQECCRVNVIHELWVLKENERERGRKRFLMSWTQKYHNDHAIPLTLFVLCRRKGKRFKSNSVVETLLGITNHYPFVFCYYKKGKEKKKKKKWQIVVWTVKTQN